MSHIAPGALSAESVSLPMGHPLRRLPVLGMAAAVIGIGLCGVFGPAHPARFYAAWLCAFLFFLTLALGALYFLLIHYATQAGWSVVLRRVAENLAATLPVFALLFIPVVIGLPALFPWARADAAADHLLAWKEPFLNRSFFLLRAAIYLVAWSAIAVGYARASRSQDATGDVRTSMRLRRFAPPAILVLALTQTFAAIYWIMSLSPKWYSTVFGVYVFAGCYMGFWAFMAIVATMLRRGPLQDVITVDHLHDVGRLMFAFVCFWAYIAFSQYFLIWYGNIPEETFWYHARMQGAWRGVSLFLAAGHFVIPFLFLMGRTVKRQGPWLVIGALWMLGMHLLDVMWMVLPSVGQGMFHPALWAGSLLAVGGVVTAVFGRLLQGRPLVPIKDPRLAESLALDNA
ncbi:MAG TPA: quinol:cytochrome C oxidoreductase [Candidatus Polarisedimenticolia bacterium]|nr:quinol:cytochrome C oxidoreductase [Candidatus Polarisedimenticolia bacterium]